MIVIISRLIIRFSLSLSLLINVGTFMDTNEVDRQCYKPVVVGRSARDFISLRSSTGRNERLAQVKFHHRVLTRNGKDDGGILLGGNVG